MCGDDSEEMLYAREDRSWGRSAAGQVALECPQVGMEGACERRGW